MLTVSTFTDVFSDIAPTRVRPVRPRWLRRGPRGSNAFSLTPEEGALTGRVRLRGRSGSPCDVALTPPRDERLAQTWKWRGIYSPPQALTLSQTVIPEAEAAAPPGFLSAEAEVMRHGHARISLHVIEQECSG